MTEQMKNTTVSNCWPPGEQTDGRQDRRSQSVHILDQFDPAAISPESLQQIRTAIRNKYAVVSNSAEGHFQYSTGKEGAVSLGYDPVILQGIKPEMLNSFCGVGNPFTIEDIQQGTVILDIGCGAGFDLIVASRSTGPSGRVFGIDLTEEMVGRAKENIRKMEISNIEILHVDSEKLPFDDQVFDVVISNGVINLSPQKLQLFQEIHRVLKFGGKLQFADIVTEKRLPTELTGSLEAWAQWIGGTVLVEDQIKLMKLAGFENVKCLGKTKVRTSQHTIGALFRAVKENG